MKQLLIHTGLLVLASLQLFAGEVKQVVPPVIFQGIWEYKAPSRIIALEAGQDHGEWKRKGDKEDFHFRRHESGSIQRVWKNEKGEFIRSQSVTILSSTENKLRFRENGSHPACYTEVTIDNDGSMGLVEMTAKHVMKAHLERASVAEQAAASNR